MRKLNVKLNPLVVDGAKKAEHSYFFSMFLILYIGIYLRHYLNVVHPELALFGDFTVHLLLPMFLVLILFLFRRSAILEMATELKWSWIGIFFSSLLGIASAYILFGSIAWLEYFINFSFNRPHDWPLIVIKQFGAEGALYLAITAGLFEEWLFKSVLIRSFRKNPSQFVFVTTSTILFGAVHYWQGPIATIIITFFYGVPSAIYYYQEKNILNLITMHVVADLLIFGWVWRALMDNGVIH